MYTIGKKIGEGSFGVVYSGTYNKKLKVAIKKSKKVQLQELEVLDTIKGQHIVKVYSTERSHDDTTIIMEECGKSLSELADTLPLEKKIDYFKQCLQGLYELHSQCVSHMDIKPANILVCKGTIKYIDFGLSTFKPLQTRCSGTIKYMAPEVLIPGLKLYDSFAADIFGLGATMVKFLTGIYISQLFDYKYNIRSITGERKDDSRGYHLVNKIKVSKLAQHSPKIPDNIVNILSRMLAIEPSDRPTIYELILELDQLDQS